MLPFVIAGLVYGGIYAIAAAGLIVTYQSAGILNFSFGAMAYSIARFYYYLNTTEHWSILPAALMSILVLGPVLGIALYWMLFRSLAQSSSLVKVVATLGISVALPAAVTLLFGNQTILTSPGLAPLPVRVFHLLGVPITLDQIIVYISVVLIVAIGVVVLYFTDVGLRVRAMVDSPAMTSLSGTNPGMVSMGVWAVSITLAGLVGVLVAPIIGLDPGDYTLLMVSAFAAVIAARLRNLPVAVIVGLIMGIAAPLVQYFLGPASTFTADVLPSVPFIVTAVFLVYFMIRGIGVDDAEGVGGALDRAITPQGEMAGSTSQGRSGTALGWQPAVIAFVVLCALPLIFSGFWLPLVGEGISLGIIYLSFTLVTGEGGMIWLCQATFAGIGGLSSAQLAVHHGWPVLAAIFVGGLIAIPFGLVIGFLTIRLGNLYVALVTLTFGLLFENLVFSQQTFSNNGYGVTTNLPSFAGSPRAFAYMALIIFAIVAMIIVNLRRSTTGLALNAVRWSPSGARTMGVSVLGMKMLVAGIAAFVAGIGGALYALSLGSALPSNYDTLLGLFWLATLVTLGIRSNVAALTAGLSFTLMTGVAVYYLPIQYSEITPILFGLGAVSVAKFPNGALTQSARQTRWVWDKMRASMGSKGASGSGEGPPELAGLAASGGPGAPAGSFVVSGTES